MPPRLRSLYSALIAVLLLIPALALYRELSRRSDIWWTPQPLALTPTAAQDRVEIYVRGKPLGALLEKRQLLLIDQAGSSPLSPSEIGLRLNNWDRVRAGRAPFMMLYGAAFGAGVVLLVLVATGRITYLGEELHR